MKRLAEAFRGEGGYTLIEMVGVLSIIGVLSMIILANTSVGDRRQQARDQAAIFVNAAKQAESYATSGKVVSDGTSRPAYGVCLSTAATPACTVTPNTAAQYFQVYARLSSDTNFRTRPNNPEVIKTYRLSRPDLQISVRLDNDINTKQGSFWLDYVPPAPSMVASYGSSSSGTDCGTRCLIRIDFNRAGEGFARDVVVKPGAGEVYVN